MSTMYQNEMIVNPSDEVLRQALESARLRGTGREALVAAVRKYTTGKIVTCPPEHRPALLADLACLGIPADAFPIIRRMVEMGTGLGGKFVLSGFGADSVVRHIPNEGEPKILYRAFATAIERIVGDGINAYFEPSLKRADLPEGERGGKEDVIWMFGIVNDFDGKNDPATRHDRLPLPCHSEVESSPGNFQTMYWFDKPQKPADVVPVLAALVDAVGSDPTGKTEDHPFRLPGLKNYPSAKKVKEGRSPEPVLSKLTMWEDPEIVPPYTLDALRTGIVAKYPQAFDAKPKAEKSANAGKPILEKELRDACGYLNPFVPRDQWMPLAISLCTAHIKGDDDRSKIEAVFNEWKVGELGHFVDEGGHAATDEPGFFASVDPIGEKGLGHFIKEAKAKGWTGNPFADEYSGAETYQHIKKPKPQMQEHAGLGFHVASDVMPEVVDWFWDQRIPNKKITMFAGFPDQGKSLITTDIAARVSVGGELPNGEGSIEQAAVLIMSAEDTVEDTIVPRLMAAGADLTQVVLMDAMVAHKEGQKVLNIGTDLERIRSMLAAQRMAGRHIKVIIIDPISAYVGGGGKSGADSHKNTEVRALLTPLKVFAEEENVAIILISHFNKGGTDTKAMYRVTDSLAFTAVCRALWLTAEEREDDKPTGRMLLLRGKGNIGRKDTPGLAYKIIGVDVTFADGRVTSQPKIVWDGVVDVLADEALAPAYGSSDKKEKAKDWLAKILSNGPVDVEEVKVMAKGRHAWSTLRRAKTDLKLEYERVGFGKAGIGRWKLPKEDAP